MSGEKGGEMQSSKPKKSYEFDDLLAMVGGFGRYTVLLYAFMCNVSSHRTTASGPSVLRCYSKVFLRCFFKRGGKQNLYRSKKWNVL